LSRLNLTLHTFDINYNTSPRLERPWQGHQLSQPVDFEMMAAMGSFMPFWFIVFYQFIPLLRDLRLLRTLPISATSLASTHSGGFRWGATR
jgi:hypothetical protein